MAAHAHNDVAAFHSLLQRITAPGRGRPPRVLALCGAGLSAASGLATFRGSTASLWHTRDPMQLATPEAFAADPALVWRFYAYRRRAALAARPNAGHRALAALAARLGCSLGGGDSVPGSSPSGSSPPGSGFLCLTQNVDGLSPRAGHPPASLRALHGSLFDLRCVEVDRGRCDYAVRDRFADPLCPALAAAAEADETGSQAASSASHRLPPPIPPEDLPTCPRCRARDGRRLSLLRPGVVWFGEALDPALLRDVDCWIGGGASRRQHRAAAASSSARDDDPGTIDLMLVVGTSAAVYPAAGYIDAARRAGAVVATVNLDAESPASLAALAAGDFAFGGSAADWLPRLLEPVIGTLDGDEDGDGNPPGSAL